MAELLGQKSHKGAFPAWDFGVNSLAHENASEDQTKQGKEISSEGLTDLILLRKRF
tara:strand:+ start:677 stop:844 length:168 start_codon:yes stop_codon:yes gene_type:complete